MTIALYSGIVADSPTDAADQVRVSVPNLTQMDRRTYGPAPFTPKVSAAGAVRFPVRGDPAIIGVDDTGQGRDWIVAWSHADSGGPAGSLFARKTTAEQVVTSTALQNDDDLFLPVAENTSYTVSGDLIWSPAIGGGLKVGWTGPAGATLSWSLVNASGNPSSNLGGTISTSSFPGHIILTGLLIVGGAAGTLQMQWAQNASHANATTLLADSWLRLEKVA